MSLPSLSVPEFQTKVPSTGEIIKYRPFLVKEEKILLMAMEGRDVNEITNAVLNLLENCILSDIDVGSLATFDIEYLFLKLRGKSVGETIEVKVSHEDKSECQSRTDITISLEDIQVVGDIADGKIMLTDDIGVKLTYPTFSTLRSANDMMTDQETAFDIMVSCIEFVFDNDNVYSDFTQQELKDWVEGLNQTQFKQITDFFDGIPKLSHEVEWKCKDCGQTETVKLEGLQSFFT
jgi:predicted ATPase